MKKVLYISNIQVPYRVAFFNQLAEKCDLTVLYEREKAEVRNKEWGKSIKHNFKKIFLNGIKVGNESSFSFAIVKYLLRDYDVIILGCYSTPVQMFANLFLRFVHKPFIINFDGEIFADDSSFKSYIKKFFIDGGVKYLVAGEKSAESVRKITKYRKPVIPYWFSSLSTEALRTNSNVSGGGERIMCLWLVSIFRIRVWMLQWKLPGYCQI